MPFDCGVSQRTRAELFIGMAMTLASFHQVLESGVVGVVTEIGGAVTVGEELESMVKLLLPPMGLSP